ncbi:hypothetical protein SASPL_107147 [Salvia splendens]|uniref:Pentatricopeptide repeat domain-containing protein 1 n=1 Tax=Salvia splendens TaxID=180675 RepID=A0A8X8YG97_SALSN|nr:hypothetical protein SASPL_107147 [Salvia splendens]
MKKGIGVVLRQCRGFIPIKALVRSDGLDEARAFFDGLWQRNNVTWNSMLSGYVKRCEIAKARWLFDKMPERDLVSWNLMISGYMSCRGRRYVEEGRQLFDEMPERSVVSWNTMISGYAKNGRVDDAFTLFDAMPEKNVVTWNAIITGLLDNGRVKRACELFRVMPERDAASLSAMVSGLIQNNQLDEAWMILLEYGELGEGMDGLIHAYNTLIAGYGQKERSPDIVTWNTMISGYVNASDMETATKLFFDMKTPDVLSWNSIISGYSREGKMKLALDFFQKMPQKNQVSWNTVIAGYEKNGGIKEAVELFLCMQAEGEKPDRHTLSSLLSICAECAPQLMGIQVHQLVTKIVIPDNPLYNSLITMYAKCGAISEARTVFDEMKSQKNVISWNCFKVKPTYITFISVLSVCAHGGLVEEGMSYFKSMVEDFGIKPRVEHFSSLVDVVGRHGKLEEAMDIINSMPVEPDKAVWGALVDACRMHNNVELARISAQALMKLEPGSSGPYVLLYNMFADAERWNEADEIRMVMEKNNIKKSRGLKRIKGGVPRVRNARALKQQEIKGVPTSDRKRGHDFVVEVEKAGKLPGELVAEDEGRGGGRRRQGHRACAGCPPPPKSIEDKQKVEKRNIEDEVGRFRPELEKLENVIATRTSKIRSLEKRINDIVDLIYKKFSESVGVKNIREYEENHLKAIEQMAADRFNLHSQQSKLKYHTFINTLIGPLVFLQEDSDSCGCSLFHCKYEKKRDVGSRIAKLESTIANLENSLKDVKQKQKELESATETANAEFEVLNEQVQGLDSKAEECEKDIQGWKKKISAATSNISKHNRQIKSKESLIDQLSLRKQEIVEKCELD